MDKKLFGTDGIRAVAGDFPLDRPTITALGRALTRVLTDHGLPLQVLIGRDTRESGPWIEEAFVRGFASNGGRVVSAGVIPTSAVSILTMKHGFSAGVVLSASHNPFRDNGIKIFSAEGVKLPDEWEARLEADILASTGGGPSGAAAAESGRGLAGDYLDYLRSRSSMSPRGKKGAGITVVLDCSNGAASDIAPRLFEALGCGVTVINDRPDGRNINLDCGSLHPESLAARVVETGAAMGVAYDGDADRAVWADEKGRVLNGDHTLFVQAMRMKSRGALPSRTVVATTMSNLGLEIALRRTGLAMVRTRVGDKYVLEEMMRRGANLGGERSGHTIFLDDMRTGDGILTSLKMLEAMAESGRPLSELADGMEEFPQVLLSIRVVRKTPFEEFPDIMGAVEAVRARLKDEGRVDLRYSGTESLARIMVEGRDWETVHTAANGIAEAVEKHLGEGARG